MKAIFPESATTPAADGRLASLDGLRGLAILLVLVFHAAVCSRGGSGVFLEKLYGAVAGLGWCGVDLFFVLSGFLITGILLESRNSNRYFLNFYMRRVLRIFPLYYGTLALFFLFTTPLFAGTALQPQSQWLSAHQVWFWAYAHNWLYTFFRWPPNLLGHFWSLAIEEQFYIVWPLLVLTLAPARLKVLCVALMALALLARLFAWAVYPGEEAHRLAYYSTLARADGLSGGALLAILNREPRGLNRYASWALPITAGSLMLFAGIVAACRLFKSQAPMETLGFTTLIVLFGAILVGAVALGPAHPMIVFFSSGPMRFFGKYSYAMYVFHWPAMVILSAGWNAARIPILQVPMLRQLGFLLATGTLTVGLALLSWMLIETPFLRLKRLFAAPRPAG